MTDKEMIKRLEAVALWVSEIVNGLSFHSAAEAIATGVESDVDAVLAALRSRPAPPDDLVALRHALWNLAGAIVAVCDGGNEEHARIACTDTSPLVGAAREAIARFGLSNTAAPAPVVAPAPVDGASLQSIDHRLRRVQTFCDSMASRARRDEEWRDAERAGEMGALLQSLIEQVATWAAPAPETPAPDAMPDRKKLLDRYEAKVRLEALAREIATARRRPTKGDE